MRRTVLLAVLAMLLMVASAVPAHAVEPLKFTEEVTGYTQPFSGCGFEGVQAVDFTYTSWTHFDKDGNVVGFRENITARTSTWTNPSNGRVLSSAGGAYTQTWNIREPLVTTITGQVATVTIPGEGLVFLDAGRVMLTPSQFVFVAGHHDLFFGPFIGAPAPDAFCAYLEA